VDPCAPRPPWARVPGLARGISLPGGILVPGGGLGWVLKGVPGFFAYVGAVPEGKRVG